MRTSPGSSSGGWTRWESSLNRLASCRVLPKLPQVFGTVCTVSYLSPKVGSRMEPETSGVWFVASVPRLCYIVQQPTAPPSKSRLAEDASVSRTHACPYRQPVRRIDLAVSG